MLNEMRVTSGGNISFGFCMKNCFLCLRLSCYCCKQGNQPLQNVCDSPWQRHWFYIKVGGCVLEEDKAQRQSCHPASWVKKGTLTSGTNSTLGSLLLPSWRPLLAQSCCGLWSFILFTGKLYHQLLNSQMWLSFFYFPPLNTSVRFRPFTWINFSHLQFVKGSLAPLSTEEDNWIELILLADFSCYLKRLGEEKHSQ